METSVHHPLIKVTADDVKKMRKFYGIDDPDRIKESLDSVYEWCQKQDHLAEACKHINRNILERMFMLAKGSIEGTKKRIDSFITCRGMMPELSLNRSVKEFERLFECVNYVPLPKLCPVDQSRVIVTQFITENLDDFTILSYFRHGFMLGEYIHTFDYTLSERYVIDMSRIHLSFLSKMNPIIMKKAEILCIEGIGTKIKGIHILNAPSFVDKFVFLIKQTLREKVASRLHVHNTYEDLHKHIPKEILPKDYDGDEQSCSKLAMQWKDSLKTEEARKIIGEYEKLVSDETKRNTSKFNEEYMGMPGSFRKLTVD